MSDVIAISAGDSHSLALKSDGSVWAWGRSFAGLGDGETTDSSSPVQVAGPGGDGVLDDVVSISAGHHHSLAVRSDGSVWSWGWNNFGKLGDDSTDNSDVPVQVVGPGGSGSLDDVIVVSAGFHHSIALKSDESIWSWGDNWEGQLGDDSTDNSNTPVQVVDDGSVEFLGDIIAITAGRNHNLALNHDGNVWGWGSNSNGQIGTEDLGYNRAYPRLVYTH